MSKYAKKLQLVQMFWFFLKVWVVKRSGVILGHPVHRLWHHSASAMLKMLKELHIYRPRIIIIIIIIIIINEKIKVA